MSDELDKIYKKLEENNAIVEEIRTSFKSFNDNFLNALVVIIDEKIDKKLETQKRLCSIHQQQFKQLKKEVEQIKKQMK
jgi:hypothetical protein